MIRFVLPVVVAAVFTASPVNAATYIGQLTGVITSGGASFTQDDPLGGPGTDVQIDLSGKPIEIDFSAQVTLNYVDPMTGEPNPRYVMTDVLVKIALPDLLPAIPVPSQLGAAGGPQSNSPSAPFGAASYTGDAQAGSFFSTGSVIGFEPDLYQTVQFTFARSMGSLTGSGTADTDFFLPTYLADERYDVAYALTGGTVTEVAAPEPATWALLVAGFGMIGGVLRRRRSARLFGTA